MWVRSSGPSIMSGILTGAMLGALSMFSSEITGQSIKSIEMSGGFRLHIRPFSNGEINLAIIGDEAVMSDPTLLDIIQKLDEEINLMFQSSAIDPTDSQTIQVYLEDAIDQLDDWFGSKVFVENVLQQATNEQVVEISSKIAVMSSRFSQENIGVLILNSSLNVLYSETTPKINESFFASFQDHFRGWLYVSSQGDLLIPSILYFNDICVGIGTTNSIYIICAIAWTGSMGDPKITNKVRSWVSMLSRRLQ